MLQFRVQKLQEQVSLLGREVARFDGARLRRGPKPLELKHEESAQIVQLYRDGMRMSDLCETSGYCEKVLRRVIATAGLPLRGRGARPAMDMGMRH